MNVVIRVDASVLVGSGHVMRCLVLANALKQKGHNILFACLPLKGDMRAFIAERGFKVITLSEPDKKVIPRHDADYEAWLQKSVSKDANDFLEVVTDADLIITDHYAIEQQWQSVVVRKLNCRLLAIDDLARCHKADLILDQTLGRTEIDYQTSKTRVLAGSFYALLQLGFSSKRESALSRTLNKSCPKLLISMGGVDSPNATLKVLETIYHQVDADFTVLLSPRAPYYSEVKSWCAMRSNVTHLDFVSDMASLMLSNDIAIGAPGTTSWERACLGLPNIIVPLANNQQTVSTQLVKHNASIRVDIEDISNRLLYEYQYILSHWDTFKFANLALCDGCGVRRVIYEIEQLFNLGADHITLERALPQDIEIVYKWQCHPQTRKYALNTRVPSWNEHKQWMSKKLSSYKDYFYIVTDRINGKKVGALRLDRMDAGHYLVSIFVEPESCGRGIARKALAMVDVIHPDMTLHATVLKANLASHRLFQKACYRQIDEETYIRQPIY